MDVSFEMFQKVADTLPISYYLGNEMKLNLSESEDQAYFDPINQEITIGYKIINNYFKKVSSIDDLEEVIRGLLYHEVSHAILTPPYLNKYSPGYGEVTPNNMPDVINVLEDQRIETLLRTFYLGVDFQKNIIMLNGWEGEDAKSGWEAFYFTTRFRHGKPELIEEVDDMIIEFNDERVNYTTGSEYNWNHNMVDAYQRRMAKVFWDIVRDWYEENKMDEILEEDANYPTYTVINDKNRVIKRLMEKDMPPGEPSDWVSGAPGTPTTIVDGTPGKVAEDLVDGKPSPKPGDDGDDGEDGDKDGEGDKDGKDSKDGDSADGTTDKNPGPRVINKPKDGSSSDKKVIQKMLDTACNKFVDEDLTFKIEEIFLGFIKRTKDSGSAMQRYSGTLNPREVGREDWRAWTFKSERGPVKGYDTLHLSLFIDTSGSYRDNEDKTNTILKSLDTLEKKYPFFKFDLVTCQVGETLRPKNERYIKASGGNWVSPEVFNIVKQLEDPMSYNIGVVLFDGCFNTDARQRASEADKNCAAWNSPRYSIISDNENRAAFEKYCPSANKIFMSGYNRAYAEKLFENIQQALFSALL